MTLRTAVIAALVIIVIGFAVRVRLGEPQAVWLWRDVLGFNAVWVTQRAIINSQIMRESAP